MTRFTGRNINREDVGRTWWKEVQPVTTESADQLRYTFHDGYDAKNMGKILTVLSEATAKEGEGRPVLTSIQVQASGDTLILAASNGYALGVVQIDLNEHATGLNMLSEPALFASKDVLALGRLLKRSKVRDATTSLAVATNRKGKRELTAQGEGREPVFAVEQPGDYPDWRILVPEHVGLVPTAVDGGYLAWAGRLFAAFDAPARIVSAETCSEPALIEGYGQNCRGLAVIMPMYIGMDSYA